MVHPWTNSFTMSFTATYFIVPAHITSHSPVSPMVIAQIVVPWPQSLVALEEWSPVLAKQPMGVVNIPRDLETSACEMPEKDYGLKVEKAKFA